MSTWPESLRPYVRDVRWLALVGVLGLVARLACAWQYAEHPVGHVMWVDELGYWSWAKAIAGGQHIPKYPFYQDPLFAYALAGLMKATGTDELHALRLDLACLGALTPLAVYAAARWGLGQAEAVIAGLAAALYGPLVFTDCLLEKEGLGAYLAAVSLALMALACQRERSRSCLAGVAGWTWGLLALVRANAILIGPLGALWWAWQSRRFASSRWRKPAAFLGGWLLAIGPVLIVNTAVSPAHELLLTTWQAGANFYIGNGPEATGIIQAPEFVRANPTYEADDYAAEAERRAGRSLAPGEVSRFWMNEGLKTWRVEPGRSCRLLVKKLALLLSDYEVPDSQSFDAARIVAAPALSWCVLTFGWVAPWAALGLVRSERTPFWWFLALSTLCGLGSTAAFFVVGRYRIPWTPGLLMLAAAGVVDLVRLLRQARWRGIVVRLPLAVAALIVAWRPPDVPAEEKWGQVERMLFVAYLEAGELDRAIDALDDGRALGSEIRQEFAAMLASGTWHDLLAANIRAALQIEPPSTPADAAVLRRVRWYRQIPETRPESRRMLESALAHWPADARFRREWAAWWLGEVDDERALHRASDELRGASADASAAILLSLLEREASLLPPADALARNTARVRLARAILADPGFARKPSDQESMR